MKLGPHTRNCTGAFDGWLGSHFQGTQALGKAPSVTVQAERRGYKLTQKIKLEGGKKLSVPTLFKYTY